MAALRSGHDSVMNFTNTGVTFGVDPLRSRLDLWRSVWSKGVDSSRRPSRNVFSAPSVRALVMPRIWSAAFQRR
jgi:hypothetical protein